MSLTKEDLVFDLYYASSTDEEGNKLAQLTVQFRDASAVPHVTTQLARTTLKRDRSKVYAVGEQSVKNGSDTLLAAIEAYYRTDPKTIFENLMAQVQDMIEGNLAPTIPGWFIRHHHCVWRLSGRVSAGVRLQRPVNQPMARNSRHFSQPVNKLFYASPALR